LEKGKTINGASYSSLLDLSVNRTARKMSTNGPQKILFHHDNAPTYFSGVVAAKLMELGFQLVPHPPYSPDLAPLDYYLFPNMKKRLAGRRFYSNKEVIVEMNSYFAQLCQSYYSKRINKLEQR
jgi:histone-lysine N-methyltransferase SETMAR